MAPHRQSMGLAIIPDRSLLTFSLDGVAQIVSLSRAEGGMSMASTRVQLWRRGARLGTAGAKAVAAHRDRGLLVHGLQQALEFRVRDWGQTDDDQPHEVVEIVIALAPIVVPAVAAVVNHWLTTRRLEDVRVRVPGGAYVSVGKGSIRQVERVLRLASTMGRGKRT